MAELRKIADEKLEQNRPFRAEMLSLIASGEALSFVGAGPSVALNYPSWQSLIDMLSVEANKISPFVVDDSVKRDTLAHAEAIQKFFKDKGKLDQYKAILGREFGPKEGPGCTETQKLLTALPFRGFVTTNYEPGIERGLLANAVAKSQLPSIEACVIKPRSSDRHMASRFLRSIVSNRGPHMRNVAYLHGRYSEVDSIILSASDYAAAYGFQFKDGEIIKAPQKTTMHSQLSWALFACRRVVFFGCSMDDPYVRALLDAVCIDLWEIDQPIHFVVLPLDRKRLDSIDNEMAAFRRYGLQVVLFDNWDGNFKELDLLLLEAAQGAVSGKTTGQFMGADEDKKIMAVVSATVDVQSAAPQTGAIDFDWLEKVNEKNASSLKKNED
jgi:hypothetical protein